MGVVLPVKDALNLYIESFTVTDEVLTLTPLGEESRVTLPPRQITGSPQFLTETDAVLSQTGAFPDKTLTVFTVEPLYISGIINHPAALPGEDYQTLVLFAHGVWKVTHVADWKNKTAGVSRYTCERYVNLSTEVG